MAYKPGDFFVSVFDLFAILLPGAMLAYIASNFKEAKALIFPDIERGSAEGWAAFVLASFVLGYFVSVAGALTDELYDPLVKRKWENSEVRRLAAKVLENSNGALKKEAEDAGLKLEGRLAERLIKATVTLRNPAAAAELERLAAISKFFRSFAVVVLVFGVYLVTYLQPEVPPTTLSKVVGGLVFIVVLCASLGLYAFHRWRRNEYICVYFIVGEKLASEGGAAPEKKGGDS